MGLYVVGQEESNQRRQRTKLQICNCHNALLCVVILCCNPARRNNAYRVARTIDKSITIRTETKFILSLILWNMESRGGGGFLGLSNSL